MDQKILFEIKKFKNKNFKAAFFTDQKRCGDLFSIIKTLPKNTLIIFREYDLNHHKRQELAQKIIIFAKKFHHKVLIGKDLQMALELGANGVHFSDHDKIPLQLNNKRNFKKDFIFSYASHGLKSILKTKNLKNDLTFISPIFKTKSHEDSKNLGLRNLRKIIQSTKKPVFALGGINKNNILSVRNIGAKGFGGIEIFLP